MIPLNINDYIQEYFTDVNDVYSSIYLTTCGESEYSSLSTFDIIDSRDLDSFDIDFDFKQSLQEIFSISDDEIKISIIRYLTKYS